MDHYVYVLQSLRDGETYTGYAGDLLRRFHDHRRGHVKSTRNRRPVVMVYFERFASKADAMARERFFKTLEGGVEKQRLIKQFLTSY